MSNRATWKYRLARRLGRTVTRSAAALTLYRMPPFVSTSALVVDGDRVLVVIDPIRGEPIIPGGHLLWDEDPAEAVVREVREETGLEIEVGDLFGVYSGPPWCGERGVVRVVYTAEARGGELTSSGEGQATWWPVQPLAASQTRDAPIVRQWVTRAMSNQ